MDSKPYLVLARKYRPNSFEEIVGQPHVVKTLQNALRQRRIAHAFLFSGPRGCGKTTTARILAKALNCEKGPAQEPCNECEFCMEITNGNALDVIEIDGASNNSVDDIRSLREKVRYGTSKARYKIYIIDEVHMLSTSAFNALLKTLEEPPPHVIFIFATTEVHKIPITIISRCQHFEFKLLSLKEIINSCKNIIQQEKLSISSQALRMIARAAEGSLRDSQSILDQVINLADGKIDIGEVKLALGSGDPYLLLRLLKAIGVGNLSDALLTIDEIALTGYDLYQMSRDLSNAFRNLLILKIVSSPNEIVDLTEDEIKEYRALAKEISIDHIEQSLITLTEMESLIKRSSNPRFILETIITRISRYAELVPIQAILKRLDALTIGNDEHDSELNPNYKIETEVQKAKSPQMSIETMLEQTSVDEKNIFSEKVNFKNKKSSSDIEKHPSEIKAQLNKQKTSNIITMLNDTSKSNTPVMKQKTSLSDEKDTIHSENLIKLQKNTRENLNISSEENYNNPDNSSSNLQTPILPEEPEFDGVKPKEIKTIWKRVVNLIQYQKKMFADVLAQMSLVSMSKDELVLTFLEDNDLQKQILSENKNIEIIKKTFYALTKCKIKVQIIDEKEHNGFSIAEENKSKEKKHFTELKKIAINKELIKKTLELFNGEITNIS